MKLHPNMFRTSQKRIVISALVFLCGSIGGTSLKRHGVDLGKYYINLGSIAGSFALLILWPNLFRGLVENQPKSERKKGNDEA
jgi:hypothetical protein